MWPFTDNEIENPKKERGLSKSTRNSWQHFLARASLQGVELEILQNLERDMSDLGL